MFGAERDLELLHNFSWKDVAENPTWQAEQLAYHYLFWTILSTEDREGWSVRGLSLSQRGNHYLLVLKATHEGTPYVAFTTEKTPTACVRSTCRRWLENRLEWHKDKFG